jgi:hypothetical protein
MGLFDDLAKIADKGLAAVESGAVEKALAGAVDKLESGLDKAVTSAEQAAAVPEKLLKAAEAKQEQVAKITGTVQTQAGKALDAFQK